MAQRPSVIYIAIFVLLPETTQMAQGECGRERERKRLKDGGIGRERVCAREGASFSHSPAP